MTAGVVCDLDAVATREVRARSARQRARSKSFFPPSPSGAAGRTVRRKSTGRCFPATALPVSSRRPAPDPQVRRRSQHRWNGRPPSPIPTDEIDSIRQLIDERVVVRSLSADQGRHDGRGQERAAQRRCRPAGAQGCARPARVVGRLDRTGGQRRSGRGGCESGRIREIGSGQESGSWRDWLACALTVAAGRCARWRG